MEWLFLLLIVYMVLSGLGLVLDHPIGKIMIFGTGLQLLHFCLINARINTGLASLQWYGTTILTATIIFILVLPKKLRQKIIEALIVDVVKSSLKLAWELISLPWKIRR